jgi:hypothetical protein
VLGVVAASKVTVLVDGEQPIPTEEVDVILTVGVVTFPVTVKVAVLGQPLVVFVKDTTKVPLELTVTVGSVVVPTIPPVPVHV